MADTLSQALLEASLLSSLSEEDEGSVVIDVDRRTMVLPTGFFFGVYNDKDILSVPFILPRYYNDLDLSEFQITVNYINSAGYGNIYRVTDAEVTESTIRFKWVTGRGVFVKEGTVRFIVCLRQIGTGGEVEKEFNTTIASANVLKGLEVDENPDPIAYSILAHMEELKDQADAAVEVVEGAADRIDDAVSEAEQAIAAMYHSPYVAPTAADMLSHDKVYVYTGNETGYTFGNWYYWNGSAFVSGGIYNATAFETDATLTHRGEAADAGAVGYQLNKRPEVKDSTEEDVDLDVCDNDGNVLVRFSDGHVKTKNFDSQNIEDEIEELREDLSDEIDSVKEDFSNMPAVMGSSATGVDLDITDTNGNVVARFSGGHIQTKNFDSSNIEPEESVELKNTDSNTDLVLSDSVGNVIAQFADGYIQTKSFDSKNAVLTERFVRIIDGDDAYTQFTYNNSAASIVTVSGKYKAGDKILCHFSNMENTLKDSCSNYKATYGYVTSGGIVSQLGQDYAYNFPCYTLPEDTDSIVGVFPASLLTATHTCRFIVYRIGAFERQPHIVTVAADGSKMFSSIRAAMDSITDNNAYNRYEIHVWPGTYNIMSDYTGEEISAEGFKGLFVKNGVSIVGEGHREKIIIHGELDPDNYEPSKRNNISTLNMVGNCGLKNLTVTNKYMRYAVHDDSSSATYQEQTRIVENCRFESRNASSGGGSEAAYGAGGSANKKLIIRDCDLGERLIIHNGDNFAVPMTAIVQNSTVKMVTLTDCLLSNEYNAHTRVEFDNCNIGVIRHMLSSAHAPSMILCGEGTHDVMIDFASGVLYNFGDCVKFPGTIPSGQAVAMTNQMQIEVTTDADIMYGVSIGNDGTDTWIQVRGYINSATVGLSGLSVGDYVTLDSNGKMTAANATEGNAVGVVTAVSQYSSTAIIKLTF